MYRVAAMVAVVVIVLLPFLYPALAGQMEYDRQQVAAGQWWRLISCHWTHHDLNHLAWDLAVFLILMQALAKHRLKSALWAVVVAHVVIGVGLVVFLPELARYRGLSGIDATLFCFLAVDLIQGGGRSDRRLGLLLLLGFAAKVIYEMVTGFTLFAQAGETYQVISQAHLWGGLCGAAGAWAKGPHLHRVGDCFGAVWGRRGLVAKEG